MADPWEDLPDVQSAKASWEELPDTEDSKLRAKERTLGVVGEALGKADVATRKEPLLKRGMDVITSTENATRGGRAGLAQGLSRGFSDELEGGLNAVLAGGGLKINNRNDLSDGLSLRTPAMSWEELKKAYTDARDARRGDIASAKSDQPIQYAGADVAGSMVGPGPGGASKLARLGYGALQGGVSGLGHSDATNVSDAAMDTGVGAGLGSAMSLAGGAISDKLAGKVDSIKAAAREAQQKIAEKALNSARGALGGEVSSGSRTLEVMEKAAQDSSLPADVRQAAADFLSGPEAAALKTQVVRSSTARGVGQLNRIQKSRDTMVDAASNLEPEAVDAATRARLDDFRPLGRRLRTLAERFGPSIALGAIGALAGGEHGALVGGGAGLGLSAIAGKPLVILQNALQDPAVASRLVGAGAAAAGGATQAGVQQAGEHAEDARKALEDKWKSLRGDK